MTLLLDNSQYRIVHVSVTNMRTIALRLKLKIWRLFFFCLLSMLAALSIAMANGPPTAPTTREFWVWDLRVMPPAFRRATATLRAEGNRSLIYVEGNPSDISPAFIGRLQHQLEVNMPPESFSPHLGIIPFEESLFGAIPRKVGSDGRLIVLFADLGQYKDTQFDGFFNVFDQLTEKIAWEKFQQHSNEDNIIYLNGFRKSESYTTGVVAHELQHLLASGANTTEREVWFSETLAEGTMLLAGFHSDQEHVDRFVRNTEAFPLVTHSYVQYGPQLLFSSFLLDSFPNTPDTAMGFLTKRALSGRNAVEQIFRERSDTPLNFDAIFSNFVSYIFTHSEQASSLPLSWKHSSGIKIPAIEAYATLKAGSAELSGEMAPYSFLAVDLAQELSPKVLIDVQRVDSQDSLPHTCPREASVLWKPVSRTRLAIYSVGCDPTAKKEAVQFRLRILDQPSLLPASPFRILP